MDTRQTIQQTVDELLQLLEVKGVATVTEQDGIFDVAIESEESGMLIGYHGETLDGLQLLLSLMVSKKIGQFTRLSVEVGDYKRNRSEYLEHLAMQVKDRVLSDGREQTLPMLKPWERRVVHLILQDDPDVMSESVGEGRDRVLVVRPKA